MIRHIIPLLMSIACCCPDALSQTMGQPADLQALLRQLKASSSDTARINTSLTLVEFYLYRSDFEGQIDSAEAYLQRAAPLMSRYVTGPLRNHYDILHVCIIQERGETSDYQKLYQPLIATCRREGDKANERFALERLSATMEAGRETDSLKLSLLQKQMTLAHELGDKVNELRTLCQIANVHIFQAKFDQSDAELLQVMNTPAGTGGAFLTAANLLSYSYFQRGQMDKALQYALKGEKYMEETGDTLNSTDTYNLLYLINNSLGKREQGLFWTKRALDHCIWAGRRYLVYNIALSVVNQMLFLGRSKEALELIRHQMVRLPPQTTIEKLLAQKAQGDIYAMLHNDPMAEKCYQEMIRYGHQNPDGYSLDDKANDLLTLGDFYKGRYQFAKAKIYLDSARAGYEHLTRNDQLQYVHLSLYWVDSAMGNYLQAIRHLKEHQRLKDTIFNIARNKQVEEMSIAYETARKEKDLTISKEKEKVATIQMHQARLSRDWIIAGSVMLLLVAALLYRQVRLKQKSNGIISTKNEELRRLVSEKEWLLKEVHHRVKNNLHTVNNLLMLQAAYLQDDALRAIENSRHRIFAMSMIHQKLYQTDDVRTVDISLYLAEFLQYLLDSFGPPSNIYIRRCIQSVRLYVNQAISIGLIINEAVTNCIKYAFPGGRQGAITINLEQKDGMIELTVADDGIGLSHDPIGEETPSLGIQLIKGLTEDLGGKVFFAVDDGTQIIVRFPAEALSAKPQTSPLPS